MQALNTYFQNAEDESKIELLSDTGWYRDDPFYKEETPVLGWALVSRDVLKHSNKKFYMQQIQEIIQHLRSEVFAERRLPSQFEEALAQFDTLSQTMKHSKKDMKPEYMIDMQVTQYTRPSAVEMLYDMMTLLKTGGEEAVIRDDRTFWTRTLDKNGSIVELSSYHSTGIDISSWKCDHKSKDLYAIVARTV
jgi:phenylalanyl-tRNA synthetase alpha subunit